MMTISRFESTSLAAALGAAIARERARTGMPRRELARRCGIAFDSLRLYERGDIEPRLSTLAKLAGALGVSLGDLTGLGSDSLGVTPHPSAGAPTLQRSATLLGLTLEFDGAGWFVRPRVRGGLATREQAVQQVATARAKPRRARHRATADAG